jgi:hypothetical protein
LLGKCPVTWTIPLKSFCVCIFWAKSHDFACASAAFAFWLAGITGMSHYAWLGFETVLLSFASRIQLILFPPPPLIAGIIGVNHHAMLQTKKKLMLFVLGLSCCLFLVSSIELSVC